MRRSEGLYSHCDLHACDFLGFDILSEYLIDSGLLLEFNESKAHGSVRISTHPAVHYWPALFKQFCKRCLCDLHTNMCIESPADFEGVIRRCIGTAAIHSVCSAPEGQCHRCTLCAFELDAADVYLCHNIDAVLPLDHVEIAMAFELVLHQSLCFVLEVLEAWKQDLPVAAPADFTAAGPHGFMK